MGNMAPDPSRGVMVGPGGFSPAGPSSSLFDMSPSPAPPSSSAATMRGVGPGVSDGHAYGSVGSMGSFPSLSSSSSSTAQSTGGSSWFDLASPASQTASSSSSTVMASRPPTGPTSDLFGSLG